MKSIDVIKKSVQDFKLNWNVAILASLPLACLSLFLQYNKTVGLLLFLCLSGPLKTGFSKIALLIADKNKVYISQILDGFKCFKNALGVFLLSVVFTVLGLLLFIVPGIIIAIWLSQSFFILAETPQLEPIEVFKKSKEIMKGNEYQYLSLIFIFVAVSVLLFILKLMFLSIFLLPIQYIVFANFYKDILRK